MSQTFCDTEILALEQLGFELELYSIYAPPTSFRHGHAQRMRAQIHYAPASPVLKLGEAAARKSGRWPEALVAEHERRYGPEYKADLRARNALYFADLFKERGITHFHVHFANRAAHTAIFVKAISGIPFSISTHGQDFMSDLGSNELLCEICQEAEFIANETEFSKALVAKQCPACGPKMHRVFNGMDLTNFPAPTATTCNPVPRIVSIGRLIEFKGFHHLIAACAKLRWRGVEFLCDIIGEGPWRQRLQEQIDQLGLGQHVRLLGSLPQEEVFAALRACDIFALACTTDQQGASDVFPTVILEAMASAKPVVSTRLAGVPEQIIDGSSGILVYPGDEAALAEALERVLTSPDRRRQLGQGGRERLEKEFSVERTVQVLKGLFEKHVPPSQAPERPAAGYASLLAEWPPLDTTANEMRDLRAANPRLRVYALEVASRPVPDKITALLPAVEFLPDGMVLEGEWQQERELARQIETWRVELGQKLSSETFLRAARHALYLHRSLRRDGVRHLHALGPRELLTGWILHRLCGVTLSVTLESKTHGLGDAVLGRLLRDCIGIRCGFDETACAQWLGSVPSRAKPFTLRHKPGRPVEREWLEKLARWGAAKAKAE